MQTATNSSVKFQPWVGYHYHSSRYGVRVMVLGESHYGEPEDYAPDFTQHVISEHAFQPGLRFFTIATILLFCYEAQLTSRPQRNGVKPGSM